MTLSLFDSAVLGSDRWRISQGDCVSLLKAMPPESVDLIVTDPAYESLEEHRRIGTTTRLTKAWFDIFPNSRFPELFAEFHRVLKPNTHCYVICDQKTMFAIKPMGEAAGFRFWKPIVWDKLLAGLGYHYRARCEFILFFEKGKRNLRSRSETDVLEVAWDEESADIIKSKRVVGGKFDDDWRAKRAARGDRTYPTEKPVDLLEILVEQSSEPNQIVLDAFCGSGSAGAAAVGTGRRFIGYDSALGAVDMSRNRLEAIGGRPGCSEARNT